MNIYPALFEEVYSAHPLVLVDAGACGGVPHYWQRQRWQLRAIVF